MVTRPQNQEQPGELGKSDGHVAHPLTLGGRASQMLRICSDEAKIAASEVTYANAAPQLCGETLSRPYRTALPDGLTASPPAIDQPSNAAPPP